MLHIIIDRLYVLRRERVYLDCLHPFNRYDDWVFKLRLRFSKGTFDRFIRESWRHQNNKPTNIRPIIQVTIALRFYYTCSRDRVGDLQGISVPNDDNMYSFQTQINLLMWSSSSTPLFYASNFPNVLHNRLHTHSNCIPGWWWCWVIRQQKMCIFN